MISLILVMVCAIAAGWLANRIQVPYPIVLPAVLYPAAIDTS